MSRCFNQILLNYIQRFSSKSDYSFYAQSVLQQINFHNQISIPMRRLSSVGLNALVFRNYREPVQWFVLPPTRKNFGQKY